MPAATTTSAPAASTASFSMGAGSPQRSTT
ncbi:Uncharacterised protein [Bordetella pertussis]|nr:Uncharacterised protein [Bordetella pertussis]CFP67971.1 Uncharacterised protein [Bordetella pertussis]